MTNSPHSQIRIDAVFNGPARTGHGGIAGGRFAELVAGRSTSVRFEAPIPLDEPLRADCDGATARVFGADGPIASVTASREPLRVGGFGRLAETEVAKAEAGWLDARGGAHIAPTCYACGNRRTDGAGLGLRPGPVENSSLFATAWRPGVRADIADWRVWAALDCPSGIPAVAHVGLDEAVVTAQLSVEIRGRVRGDGDYQLLSRRVGGDGRKHHTEAALIDERGRALAVATALWITVPLAVMQPERTLVGVAG